jgi:hypothetical protein
MKEGVKPQVVSDKAEKQEVARLLHNETAEKFAGVNGRGSSIDELPVVPVGSAIFLKWNLPGSSLVGLKASDMKPKVPYWEVIGIGATVSTVNIGDKILLKERVDIASFDTSISDDLRELPEMRYHIIYEHGISAILK